MDKDWKDYNFAELTGSDYTFRMLTAGILFFSICLAITSVYIISVGYGLASFYFWAFTTNFWLPISYHTWFILATIPFINVLLIAIAIIALALKFSIIYFVTGEIAKKAAIRSTANAMRIINTIFRGLIRIILRING